MPAKTVADPLRSFDGSDVDSGAFDYLMDLLFLELGILGFVDRGGFFPGGLFEVEAFHEVREVGADGVALKQGQAGKADVIGVEVSFGPSDHGIGNDLADFYESGLLDLAPGVGIVNGHMEMVATAPLIELALGGFTSNPFTRY